MPYSTNSYLHILVFVFVSCLCVTICKILQTVGQATTTSVLQFVKFCKLWTRLRQHVFPFLKHYWSTKCHISYQNNHNKRNHWNHQIHHNHQFHKKHQLHQNLKNHQMKPNNQIHLNHKIHQNHQIHQNH